MKCPYCGTEFTPEVSIIKPQRIGQNRILLDETKRIEYYVCQNKKCSKYGKLQKYDTKRGKWIS